MVGCYWLGKSVVLGVGNHYSSCAHIRYTLISVIEESITWNHNSLSILLNIYYRNSNLHPFSFGHRKWSESFLWEDGARLLLQLCFVSLPSLIPLEFSYLPCWFWPLQMCSAFSEYSHTFTSQCLCSGIT